MVVGEGAKVKRMEVENGEKRWWWSKQATQNLEGRNYSAPAHQGGDTQPLI